MVTGGDLVMDILRTGTEEADQQYALFDAQLHGVKVPVHHTMGNHDVLGVYADSGLDPTHPKYGKKAVTTYVDVNLVDTRPGAVTLPVDFTEETRRALMEPYAVAIDESQLKRLGVKLINTTDNKRLSLDELQPGTGDYRTEPEVQCGIFCEMAEREYRA